MERLQIAREPRVRDRHFDGKGVARGPDHPRCASLARSGSDRHHLAVEPAYTPTQGPYLAFIYYYTKLNGVPPAEADFQRYFKVSPPSVHQMIVTLERRGIIERTPGVGRSIRLRLSRDQLPDLL
jgi:DNA-binding MarR family transcriptional regulator